MFMPHRLRLFATALVFAGLFAESSSACIFHEADDIEFVVNWCAEAEQAEAWTDTSMRQPLRGDDGQWPKGCICAVDAQTAILERWVEQGGPPSGHPDEQDYVVLHNKVLKAARAACTAAAEDFAFNSCFGVLTEDTVLFQEPRDSSAEAPYCD